HGRFPIPAKREITGCALLPDCAFNDSCRRARSSWQVSSAAAPARISLLDRVPSAFDQAHISLLGRDRLASDLARTFLRNRCCIVVPACPTTPLQAQRLPR